MFYKNDKPLLEYDQNNIVIFNLFVTNLIAGFQGVSSEEREAVLAILSHIQAGLTSEEDISDQDQVLYTGSSGHRTLCIAFLLCVNL